MTGAALTGTFTLGVSGHSLRADLSPERRASLAELWREIAVGHLERARLMRREGDTVGAAEWEEAAGDWCSAAEVLEWGVAA